MEDNVFKMDPLSSDSSDNFTQQSTAGSQTAVQNERQPQSTTHVSLNSINMEIKKEHLATTQMTLIIPPDNYSSVTFKPMHETCAKLKPEEVEENIDVTTTDSENDSATFDTLTYTSSCSEGLDKTAARLLFMTVKWAKNLSGFAHLAFRDQVILLEEAWSVMFLLCAIQWSLPMDRCPLLSKLSQTQLIKIKLSSVDLQVLEDIFNCFKALAVDLSEFACLKAIVLFKSETHSLKDPKRVENLQDQSQVLLSQHIHSVYSNQTAR